MLKTKLIHKNIPSNPGVYFFLGRRKEILYIGKATALKSRVKSYFDTNIKEKRNVLIEKMVAEAQSIRWVETDSVLEAMILEVNLIRTHKPTYNTRSKDDRSYNCVVITKDEFPRVLVVRGKDLLQENSDTYASVFGPFPNGMLFKEALKIIRKLFQFYDLRAPIHTTKNKMLAGKIDFNRQIGLYPEVCSKAEYARTIRHIKLFFEGKKQRIISELEKQMFACAKNEAFEQANILKKKIFALKHIQDISLLKDESRIHRDDRNIRIEAYDIAHLAGSNLVGVMTVLQGGEPEKHSYRKFEIKGFEGVDDTRALREIIQRRFTHAEWRMPDIVVVDGSTAQINVVEKIFAKLNITVPVVGVVKDERHRPKHIKGVPELVSKHEQSILFANAEAHRFAITYHRAKRKLVTKP